MPDVSDTTEAAELLRSLLVSGQVWSIIHQRIFAPFLFTSAYGTDGWDDLERILALLSANIRAKSFRREAIWRAIMMRAIYTGNRGRKAAMAAATGLSRDIMEAIGVSTLDGDMPGLLQAVRVVAKRAVQTWRRARLEWNFIHSVMPSTSDTTWDDGAATSPSDIVLWVRPHIVGEVVTHSMYRDPGRTPARSSPQRPRTPGRCVYLQGRVLRQNSRVTQAR